MSAEVISEERTAAPTLDLALDGVREQSTAAGDLMVLCAFLAADDIPRRMLNDAAVELPAKVRTPIADPGALQAAVEVLWRYKLVQVAGDALGFHRTHQAAIRNGLAAEDRCLWATAAAKIVLAAFPERAADSKNWQWAARLLPHALATADHLEALHIEPLVAVELWDRAARYLIAQGQLDIANGVVERGLARAAKAAPRGVLHGTLINTLAMVERDRGWFNRAKQHATEALGIHRASVGTSRPAAERALAPEPDAQLGTQVSTAGSSEIAQDLQNVAVIATRLGDYNEAMEHLGSAWPMLVGLHGEDDPLVADALMAFFNVYIEAEMFPQAIEALGRAIDVAARADGSGDVDLEISRLVLRMLTEPENLVERARETLQITENAYGSLHPRTADSCRLLSALLRRFGQLHEAHEMASRAADIDRSNYGPLHFQVGGDIVYLLAVDAARGDLESAERRLSDLAQIVMAARTEDRQATLRLSGLRDVLADAATTGSSAPLVERVLATLQTAFAEDTGLLAFTRELVTTAFQVGGDVLLREGRPKESAVEYQRGLGLALLTTENFLDDAVFQIRLAFVMAKSSDRAAMDRYCREALASLSRAGHAAPIWYIAAAWSSLAGAVGRVPAAEEALANLITEAIEGGAVSSFRGQLSAAIPHDWFAKESTMVLAPDGQANVIASSEPLDPTIDTEQYAAVQGDLLRTEFPEFEEKEYDAVLIFGGRSGYMRSFEWTPPDGVRVAQIQLYHAANGRGYTATATTPLERFAERELLLRQILLGLRIVD